MLRGKKEGSILSFSKEQLRKKRLEKNIIVILFSLTIISTSFLLIFISGKLLITGYVSYIESRAGYVTEVNISQKFSTTYWSGTYGLALRVPEFTEQIKDDFQNGDIERVDVFFSCLQSDAVGGTEVYASINSSVNIDSLSPATSAQVDNLTGCVGKRECASNTFTSNMSVMIGSRNVTGIPSTFTYRFDGNNTVYDIGILNDSFGSIVYVTHIGDIQRGFSNETIVNFQMLLPIRENQTERYYFYTDPNDVCPSGGGIGNNVNASLSGYVLSNGNALANASVTVAGYTSVSDTSGFYNVTFVVLPGNYSVIAVKEGYDVNHSTINITFSDVTATKNITLYESTPGNNETIRPYVSGFVSDGSGNKLSDVKVYLGNVNDTTNSSGFYSFYPLITAEPHPIVAVKSGYDNYYSLLNITDSTTNISFNFSMEVAVEDVGPYTTGPHSTGPYTNPPASTAASAAQKRGEDYWISSQEIKREIRQNTFIEETLGLYNFKFGSMSLIFSLSPELEDFIKLDKSSVSISSDSFSNLVLTIYGTKPLGTYNGSLKISGTIEREIPITIEIIEKKSLVETLLMEISLVNSVVAPGSELRYKLNLQNLLRDQGYQLTLRSYISDINNTKRYILEEDEEEIENSLTLLKEIEIPDNLSEDDYVLNIEADYLNHFSKATSPFKVSKPIYLYSVLGIPLWLIFAIISFFGFIFLNFFMYKTYRDRKKRYRIALDPNSLPKPGEGSVRIGNIAETKTTAYYEIDKLTTHAIVAGATGMGKSISAQVIIEEALLHDVAVIVFDPTAQWSGMLRKCDDKKMLSYYPKFGLKETDAKSFKGSVRQVNNARELINIKKYMNPGQIQIFTLNKLDPKDIDMFVANVIRQVFKSDPKEAPNLKLILVFDEVHRLLSKFGGSGEGFLQVERACREFRKWGIGVMLISQVLSDFVGEIKANINTEVQTRTLEESDLERIKTKFGESFLKSLVRAEVGVAMFQNAEYNRGRPYFVNFRPILHNTRRLPDEELEKYNKYNDIADDLEYQIEQLEKEKVDTFDLKMELKLVKDKIMTGNFSVVEIYLEGLKPRLEKEWEKLGKKPKKREIQLIAKEEIQKSIEEAKKSRAKFEKEEAKKKKVEKPVKADAEDKQDKETKIEADSDKIVKTNPKENNEEVTKEKEISKEPKKEIINQEKEIEITPEKKLVAEKSKKLETKPLVEPISKSTEKIPTESRKTVKDAEKMLKKIEKITKNK